MGIDYLLQKPDEYVSIEATWYRHIAHMTVTTDGCNLIYTKPYPRFDDSWSVTSSVPGRTAMVVRWYTTFVNCSNHADLQTMAERTYREVALNSRWSYRALVEKVDAAIEAEVGTRNTASARCPYTAVTFQRAVCRSMGYFLRRRFVLMMQSVLLGMPLVRKSLFGLWQILPRPVQQIVRPLAQVISR